MNINEVVARLKIIKDEIEVEELTVSGVVERIDDIVMELEEESPFTSLDDESLDNFSMRDYS